jgi:DNA-binding transcriptional regulator/RsmH inhibitor MraZ
MIDRYGNYFFQELISKCNSEQRLQILKSINTNFIEICTDKKGTHTVQRLIDMVSTSEEEKALGECIQGQVVKLAMDAQGTHVMQKYVKVN